MAVQPEVRPIPIAGTAWRPPARRWRSVREQLAAFSFVVPALGLLAIFLIYPIAVAINLSFQRWNLLGAPANVGWNNYNFLLGDGRFWRAVWNTVFFVLLAVPAQMALGLFLAVLLNNALAGRRFFRTVFFVPMAMSMVAAGLVFRWLFTNEAQTGFVPTLLGALGLSFPAWQTQDGVWAMIVVVIVNTWKATGYAMVVYLAGLQSISSEIYEAAAIDGTATEWRKFRDITFPLLAPTTFLLVVTTTIFSFRAFEQFFIMTAGGPAGATTTLVYYIYDKFPNQIGIASAAATLMLIGVFMLTAVQFSINRRRETYY